MKIVLIEGTATTSASMRKLLIDAGTASEVIERAFAPIALPDNIDANEVAKAVESLVGQANGPTNRRQRRAAERRRGKK
jgi:hypothetical protein